MGAAGGAALTGPRPRALALAAALAASPLALAFEADVRLGAHAHRLRELGADGATLVREHGVGPRGELRLSRALSDGVAMRASFGGWTTRAHYDGRTQGGLPTASRTGTTSLALQASLAWQPSPAGFGLEAGLQVERLRRRIEGTGGYGGLDEVLVQPRLLLNAGWRTADTTLAAGVLWGPRGSLSVRFDDRLFDRASLRSGHSTGFAVELSRRLGDGWRIGVQADVLGVGASRSSSLQRDGETVGRLSQPRWRRDQLTVLLERSL